MQGDVVMDSGMFLIVMTQPDGTKEACFDELYKKQVFRDIEECQARLEELAGRWLNRSRGLTYKLVKVGQ